jgi:hypothetical protein
MKSNIKSLATLASQIDKNDSDLEQLSFEASEQIEGGADDNGCTHNTGCGPNTGCVPKSGSEDVA